MSTSTHWLERRFQLRARGSTVGREVRGAVATFLTMAYILFVNPDILASAGVPRHSAVACTALAAAVCCVLMGLGFIAYVVVQVASLRLTAVHPAMYVTAAAFAAFFAWGQA
jgi:AGZA family xanthine/uracil permease-like MFS transporter